MAEVSVVIPTYNEEKGIEATLQAISSQTLPRSRYEIIVVDGGSKDRTREIASKYADKVILQKSKNVGGARNDGAEVSSAGIVANTDADVLVPSDWLEKILSHFKEGVVAVCGPDVLKENKAKYRILYTLMNFSNLVAYHLLGFAWTRGTNTAVRKESFFKVGGYSDLPFGDDGELGLRLKKVGKIVYTGDIEVKMSARRFEKYGVLSVLKVWIKGDLMLMRGKRTEAQYQQEQY